MASQRWLVKRHRKRGMTILFYTLLFSPCIPHSSAWPSYMFLLTPVSFSMLLCYEQYTASEPYAFYFTGTFKDMQYIHQGPTASKINT